MFFALMLLNINGSSIPFNLLETDPMGRKHYWFTVSSLESAEEGTDRWAVENGYVSITPLHLDLTNEKELRKSLEKQSVRVKIFNFSEYYSCSGEGMPTFN